MLIRFHTGNRTTYVVRAQEGTLASIMTSESWKEQAMSLFLNAKEVREDFNGAGATLHSSSQWLRPDQLATSAVRCVREYLEEGYVPIETE